MPKKTLKQWNESNKKFDDFFKPLDEVDEDLVKDVNHFIAPRFADGIFIQCGECDTETKGVKYYMTFCKKGDKFYYLGSLPKFKSRNYNY